MRVSGAEGVGELAELAAQAETSAVSSYSTSVSWPSSRLKKAVAPFR
jgi:hypothetical protein